MSQSVCPYSELEHYSGSISNNLSDLPRLIWDLKFACLFYDVVVLHRRNLFEHRLTLPAFEILAPFVKSGQLWTSANEYDRLPVDYVRQKTEQLEEFYVDDRYPINQGNCKNIKNALNDIKERWLRIELAEEWKICRNGNEQASSVLKQIADPLFHFFEDKKFRGAHSVLDLFQHMQADNNFDKEKLLAKVGKLRGKLPPTLLSEIAMLIQTEFVRAGANFNNNAVIYPGKSVQCLANPHFEPLPFANQTLHQVKERIKSMGFNLDELINLPVPMLFEIAQSPQWLMIRNALLNDIFKVEIQKEMRSVFSTNLSFPNKVEKLLNISCHFQAIENPTPHLSPIFMLSPWGLVSQSLLGSASVAAKDDVEKVSNTFILDIESGELYDENSPHSRVKLTKRQTNLLSMLVIVGESGLTIYHIKQLCLEFDLIEWKTPKWESQAKQSIKYDDALLYRSNMLKKRTNDKLKPLGLKIAAEKGKKRWYLEKDCTIKLFSSVWGEIFEKKDKKGPPQGLSPQSKAIWNCLWEYSPKFVHAEILAEVLGKEWNEKTPKQISDAVYKLKKCLKNEQWLIRASQTGEYTLGLK